MKIERHNFDKKIQMHLVCIEDPLRKFMSSVHFIGGYAYATDGVMLVRNKINEISDLDDAEIDALDGKSIRADFFKEMLKYDTILINEDGIECQRGDDKAFYYFSTYEKVPDIEKALNGNISAASEHLTSVGIDFDRLQKMNKAMKGNGKFCMNFNAGNCIVIKSILPEIESIGIIIRINEEE